MVAKHSGHKARDKIHTKVLNWEREAQTNAQAGKKSDVVKDNVDEGSRAIFFLK